MVVGHEATILSAAATVALRGILVPGGGPTEALQPSGPPMNCWIPPDFDPIATVYELTTRLNGRGSAIELTYPYLDSKSRFAITARAHRSVLGHAFRKARAR